MAAKESSDDEAVTKRLRSMLVHCVGFEGDELAEMRRDSYKYYYQRPRGDELPGRSQIVTNDVSAMVEGNLTLMAEPLVNKRIAEFCSYDAQDYEQARLESDAVQYMLFKEQNGFIEMVKAIKDSLLVRNAVVKVYVDRRTYKKTVRRENVDPAVVTEVLDQIGDVKVHKFDTKGRKLSATVVKETKEFIAESIAPENLMIPKDWHKNDFKGIPIIAEWHCESRSTLIERGFPKDKVNKLRRYNSGSRQNNFDERLPRGMTPHSMAYDKSQQLVGWYECHVKVNAGDGTSELRRISFGDNVVLEDVPADLISYAMGVCIINPHTFMGISLYDKGKWVQDSTTALTRGLMDNLNATNKNRTMHLDGVVNQEDLDDGRINSSIRVNSELIQDVRQAMAAFAVPDTSANILGNLNHFRTVRSESGGAATDLATGSMQLNDRVGSQGLDRAYSVMESFAKFMTQVFAHTLVRNMFLIAHEVLRTQWRQPIKFERGNEWIQTDPSKWPVRKSVEINLGKALNERQREAAVLDKLMEKQAALASLGMENILVNVNTYYETLMAWLRVNDIDTPERFVIDPRKPEAQKAMKDNAIRAQQDKQQQAELVNQSIAIERIRVALGKYQTDVETQFKYWNAVLEAQIKEAQMTAENVTAIKTALIGKGSNDTGRTTETRVDAPKESATKGDTRTAGE